MTHRKKILKNNNMVLNVDKTKEYNKLYYQNRLKNTMKYDAYRNILKSYYENKLPDKNRKYEKLEIKTPEIINIIISDDNLIVEF